jgi:hypothetical protein
MKVLFGVAVVVLVVGVVALSIMIGLASLKGKTKSILFK